MKHCNLYIVYLTYIYHKYAPGTRNIVPSRLDHWYKLAICKSMYITRINKRALKENQTGLLSESPISFQVSTAPPEAEKVRIAAYN